MYCALGVFSVDDIFSVGTSIRFFSTGSLNFFAAFCQAKQDDNSADGLDDLNAIQRLTAEAFFCVNAGLYCQ